MSTNQEQIIEKAARAVADAVKISIRPGGETMRLLDKGHTFALTPNEARTAAHAVLVAIHPTVTTETELDALPVGSVILADGETWRRVYDGATHSVWHGGRHGYECAQDVICPESSATVLHIPGGAA